MICSDLPLRGILTGIFMRKYTSSFSPIVVSRICLKQAVPIPPLFPCSTTVYKMAPAFFFFFPFSIRTSKRQQARQKQKACLLISGEDYTSFSTGSGSLEPSQGQLTTAHIAFHNHQSSRAGSSQVTEIRSCLFNSYFLEFFWIAPEPHTQKSTWCFLHLSYA